MVATLLGRWFDGARTLTPSARLTRSIVDRCAKRRIDGGAVYDALVGLTAAEAGASLLTRDRRAARTYLLLGVDYELMSGDAGR